MTSKHISIPVPTDFPIILEQLIKCILRDQPKDIIAYCLNYFSLMQKNQKGQNISQIKTNDSLKKSIQATFKKYFVKKLIKVSKDEIFPFIRFHTSSNDIPKESIPNKLTLIMLMMNKTQQFTKEQFIDLVTKFLS